MVGKMANGWELPISTLIPYLGWAELNEGEVDTWEAARHNHAAFELHVVLSGECNLFIRDAQVTLRAGQGILISPEVYHAPCGVTPPFLRLSASFYTDEESLLALLPAKGSFAVFLADASLLALCDQILFEAKDKDRLFSRELLSNQFAQLILRILRMRKETEGDAEKERIFPKRLEDMNVIDAFFANTPPKLRTKENLAKSLHCSERQVLRKLRALYGMSFQKKQMLSRLDTAQHLLRVTDKSVEEICALIGYADTAAFYKAFKAYTDTTPRKYRKRGRS